MDELELADSNEDTMKKKIVVVSILAFLLDRYPRQFQIDEGDKYRNDLEYIGGARWIQLSLSCPNPERMKEDVGVYPGTFYTICNEIAPHLHLSALKRHDVSLQEMVATFLMINVTGGGTLMIGTLKSFRLRSQFFPRLSRCKKNFAKIKIYHSSLFSNNLSPFPEALL